MVHKIWIKQHRNLENIMVSVNQSRNVYVYGLNNQGKTNFLEAVYMCAFGRSPQESEINHCIPLDKPHSVMGVAYDIDGDSHQAYVKFSETGQKEISLDGQVITSFRSLQKQIPMDYVSADVIRLFQGYPDTRRRDLDQFVGQLDHEYTAILKRYSQVLKQKSAALKESINPSSVDVWNDQLIPLAEVLVNRRLLALKQLSDKLQLFMDELGLVEFSKLDCLYQAKSLGDALDQFPNYQEKLKQKLKEGRLKEWHSKQCLYGPHRDDFSIRFDGKSLTNFFSRGINRAVSLLVKVAQLQILSNRGKGFPLLLLDDALAEIDDTNRSKLLPFISAHTQIFYTTTDRSDENFLPECMVYQIKKGVLSNG
ncbi:DNA replication/repair protein RecF [bacterium]|jgi:DNA replication and repair protein RecF|nr:DNA replication/repair protein RecF [bacterium]